MNNITRPDWLLDIPSDEYHAATKAGEFVSSHRLNVFRRCPLEYKKRLDGEIVDGETDAFALGRATHTYIIEGKDAFDREFVVSDGPINPKTGRPFGRETVKFREWAATQEKATISNDEFALINLMASAVRAHEKAAELFSRGFAEGVVRTKMRDLPCQVRMDWYDPERDIIVDLKTCQDVDKFVRDIREFGYVSQLAFYAAAVAHARRDTTTPSCWLVAVEKKQPFRVAVYHLTPFTINEANENPAGGKLFGAGNYTMLDELGGCVYSGKWPTRYEGFGTL